MTWLSIFFIQEVHHADAGFCIPSVLAYGIGSVFLILFAAIGKLWLSNQKKEDQLYACLDARIAHGESIKGALAEVLKELLGEEKDGDS